MPDDFAELDGRFFGIADDGAIDKIGQRLRVEGAGPADDHQWIIETALRAAPRNAGQVEHVENVGVGELVLQREADNIEIAKRQLVLEALERLIVGPQHFLHVGPGCIAPLGSDPVSRVEVVVEDGIAEMAHADLVGIGESEGETEVDLA